MDVTVSRSGGFAGLSVRWRVHVDDQPDAETWYLLIASIPWDDVPETEAQPDRFTYRIECRPHEARLADRQLDGPWRELVDRVQARGRRERA